MGSPDGSTLGDALSRLFAKTYVNATTAITPAQLAAQAKARGAQMEEWERELAPFFRDVIGSFLEDETLTEEQRAILQPLVKPTHQTDFLLSALAALGIILTALPAAASGMANGLAQRSMRLYAQNPVPIEAIISGRVSDRFDTGWAAENGSWQGFHLREIEDMVTAARPAVPPAETLEAARRGTLSDGQAAEWLADAGYSHPAAQILMTLKDRIPDLGLVISAVTQSQLSDSQAQGFIKQHGIDLSNYNWIRETAGQSPGIDLVLELLNKRLISESEARTAVLESPIKNKYLEAMMKARFRIPPMEQTVSMLRRGAYTPGEAADNLSRLGYFPEDIAKLVDWATQEKVSTPRDLTAGQIVDNYEVGLIDRAAASSMLVALRYDATEAAMYLDLADAKKARAKLDRAVSKVHSRYVAWKINDIEATTALDALGVPIGLRDELFDVWNVEREVNHRELTPAQIVNAYFGGYIPKSETFLRLKGLGYDDTDATIFMALQGITDESPEVVE